MKEKKSYAPVLSWKFWKAVFIHLRPYLLFISGVAGLAGMAVAPSENISLEVFLIAFIPFFLGYGFGQALTDCFQIDTDTISAPYRPLSKGEISPWALGIVSLTGLVLIGFALVWLNFYNLIFGMLSIIGLATYSYFKRNFWVAGPFYNAWIVTLLPVMGFLAVTGAKPGDLINKTMIFQVLLTFFAYANFVVIGYLKDISADRATHYKTFPVVFGWNKTIIAGDLNVLCSIVISYLLLGNVMNISFIIFLLASFIAISGQIFGHLTKRKEESNAVFPIISTVRSFILWHLAVVLHYHPGWLIFCAIFYSCFELSLYFRPEKSQI
ncbi:MAG: UbiA family prenyltransferase [Bacteroidales bacterium]|nr:UbiA family prenyltransferase [Lentimicrobiaceae bacterium]MDD5695168.1 UbiA family prenyltransferase [Bacteroidales bacterium]